MVVYNYLYMQSVSITTKVVSLDPTHGEVHSTQYYVIKWFSLGIPVSPTNKTVILLKVLTVLNTITPPKNTICH